VKEVDLFLNVLELKLKTLTLKGGNNYILLSLASIVGVKLNCGLEKRNPRYTYEETTSILSPL
jgi:hypothetical protein